MAFSKQHPQETAGRAAEKQNTAARTTPVRSESEIAAPAGGGKSGKHPKGITPSSRARWWPVAFGAAALLVIIAAGGVYLLTRRPSTVDHYVILTVPSGAEIRLNAKDYGQSPVKLEQIPIGTYRLQITKEGYAPVDEWINVTAPDSVERKLKPLPLSEDAGLPPAEMIRRYQQRAEAAFAAEIYVNPPEMSALSYANRILEIDAENQYAKDMRERIRQMLHQSAKAELGRGDLATAYDLYAMLVDNFSEDEEARAAQARLDGQLSSRRGESREFIQRAESALRAGYLLEPEQASALYFAKQALARDRQNTQALTILNQVRDRVLAASERAYARGDTSLAVRQLQRLAEFFPKDSRIQEELREMLTYREPDIPKAQDPKAMRLEGLHLYRREDFTAAIPYLENAYLNGSDTPEVVFALAHSLYKTGQYDQAAAYLRKIPAAAHEPHRSALALLGDIAMRRGDTTAALAHYNEALRLGGSTLYLPTTLEDKIETIERRQREKAAEPTPVTIRVRHLHGGFFQGSCRGVLTVNSTSVRYDGDNGEHKFSANLMRVDAFLRKDEMTVQFQKLERFKASAADAERFQEALSKYQKYFAAK